MLRRVAGPGTARREGWRCNRSRYSREGIPVCGTPALRNFYIHNGNFCRCSRCRRKNGRNAYKTSVFRPFGRKCRLESGEGRDDNLRGLDFEPHSSRAHILAKSGRQYRWVLPGSLSQSTDSCERGIFGFLSFRPPSPFRVPPRRSIRGTSMGTVGRID